MACNLTKSNYQNDYQKPFSKVYGALLKILSVHTLRSMAKNPVIKPIIQQISTG
jgi:hypothetical protein